MMTCYSWPKKYVGKMYSLLYTHIACPQYSVSLAFMTSHLPVRDHVSDTLLHISGSDTTDMSVARGCLFCSSSPKGYARAKVVQFYTSGEGPLIGLSNLNIGSSGWTSQWK